MTRPPGAPGANRPRGFLHSARFKLAVGLAAAVIVGGAAYINDETFFYLDCPDEATASDVLRQLP